MKHYFVILLFFSSLTTIIYGQSKPFPQNVNYGNGYKSSAVTATLAQSEYNRWKGLYLVSCNGNMRPTTETAADTKVEAMGFSMLLAAYEGDKTAYDGLYGFYRSKRNAQANNMMGWWVTCDGFHDQGSATDGDLDVAFSLILAYNQWGGGYLDSAINAIHTLKNSIITQCTVNGSSVNVLKGGYSNGGWGGCSLTDMSYYTPAFFRIFGQVTNDNTWNQLADDTYTILNASANSNTGLVPDWQTADGVAGPPGWNGTYAYDASRVPWRIAIDYLWNGNANAQAWCTKVTNWANGIGAANITDGYNLDGTTTRTLNNNSAFVGGFAVGAMCNSQAVTDNFGTRMSQLSDSYWYNLTLRVVYLHVMTGNFWKPDHLEVGTNDIKDASSINIFPNPIQGDNKLKINGLTNARTVQLFSISGQAIASEDVKDENVTLDVTALAKGAYIIKVIARNGNQQNFKFIK